MVLVRQLVNDVDAEVGEAHKILSTQIVENVLGFVVKVHRNVLEY